MDNLSSFQLTMEFEFGIVNGQIIKTLLQVDEQRIPIIPDDKGLAKIAVTVDLPAQLVLTFSNKDPNTGTLIDDCGNIIKDVFVKILSISFDGFELNEKFIHQKIKLLTETGQEIFTSYIGFNGIIVLNLTESNVFSQYVLMNS